MPPSSASPSSSAHALVEDQGNNPAVPGGPRTTSDGTEWTRVSRLVSFRYAAIRWNPTQGALTAEAQMIIKISRAPGSEQDEILRRVVGLLEYPANELAYAEDKAFNDRFPEKPAPEGRKSVIAQCAFWLVQGAPTVDDGRVLREQDLHIMRLPFYVHDRVLKEILAVLHPLRYGKEQKEQQNEEPNTVPCAYIAMHRWISEWDDEVKIVGGGSYESDKEREERFANCGPRQMMTGESIF